MRQRAQAGELEASGIEPSIGALEDRAALARAVKDIDVVYHIAAVYRQAGIPASAYRAVNATAVGDLIEAAAERRPPRRALQHGRRARRHRASAGHRRRAAAARRHLSGDESRRRAGGSRGGGAHRHARTIARPSGIYGPGDRRLLKLFRGVARRRFVVLGSGDIFYHLTYIDDLVEGFRLCGEVPAAANRTYILAAARSRR